MENIIIAEGVFDVELLTILLPEDLLLRSRLINAGGYSSALSLAKTFLERDIQNDSLVSLVVDSDTTDEIKIKEKENFIRNYIGGFNNFNLFIISPEMEAILFESEELIERVAEKSVSNYELTLGKFNPREALKQLSIKDQLKFLPEISENDKNKILNNSQITNLINTLKEIKKIQNQV